MKKILIVCLCLFLGACSSAQLTALNAALNKYDAAIANFNAAVARIDTSVAFTSSSFSKYCTQARLVGNNLSSIVQGNDVALTGLNTVSAGIDTWCQNPPQNTADAVVAMTAVIASGEAAYKAAH